MPDQIPTCSMAVPRLVPGPVLKSHGNSKRKGGSQDSAKSELALTAPQKIPPISLRFDLEKTFPAILVPIALLRKIADSPDFDALRALVPVFLNCLNNIMYSIAQLPVDVRSSSSFIHAEKVVTFYQTMLEGYFKEATKDTEAGSDPQTVTDRILRFLDICLSSLKRFLQVAAHELVQVKPLPLPPSDSEQEEPEHEFTKGSETAQSSEEDAPLTTTCGAQLVEDNNSNGQIKSPQKDQKIKFSLLKSMSTRRKKAIPHDGEESPASSTLVSSDHIDLKGGYVHVSTNIRNSIAQFPDCIKGPIPDTHAHAEDATEIWKDRNGLVELASLKALVRYMTSKSSQGDVEITDVFFLCFRFFSTPMEIFNAFVARYDEKKPRGLTAADASIATLFMKIRVAKLLYLWVDLHWRPEEDNEVFSPLMQFAFSRLSKDLPKEASAKLVSALHDRACAGDEARGLRVERTVAHAESRARSEMLFCTWEPKDKKTMLKGDFSKVNLLNFNASGGHSLLALQLTLFLWERYCCFQPEDAVRYLMVRKGDDNTPTTEVARQVSLFMSYEKALHRWVMDALASATTTEMRTELIEMFLDVAQHCHDMRNFSASCLISLACDRPTVLPFVTKIKLSAKHQKIKATLSEFHTGGNNHLRAYKDALKNCHCAALPGMMLFIGEVARGCGSGPYDAHPNDPGSCLVNLRRYRPITWAVRAMERCHVPFKIQRIDYVCNWLDHVLSQYRQGTEIEWENRIYAKCRKA
ncbi:hypothetical protein ID866_1778 [Astraeus odoratus]|nr:hypothetical protein ID866_1778 [Astraeus odoratus]